MIARIDFAGIYFACVESPAVTESFMQESEQPDPSSLPPHLRELREDLLAAQAAESSGKRRKEKVSLLPDLLLGLLAIAFFAAVFGALGIFEGLPRVAGFGITGGSLGAIGGGLAAWFIGLVMTRNRRRLSLRMKRRDTSVSALIVAADLARSPSRRGGWVYAVVIAFQFEADGRTHTGQFRIPETAAHNMMSLHKRVMKENHPGKVINVFYERENPENAGLSRRGVIPWLSLFIFLIVGGAVTGFGVHMLRVGITLLLM